MIFFLHENNLKHIGLWLCALVILALLPACGQKGDLYLPDEPNDLVYAPAEGEGLAKAFISVRRSRK